MPLLRLEASYSMEQLDDVNHRLTGGGRVLEMSEIAYNYSDWVS